MNKRISPTLAICVIGGALTTLGLFRAGSDNPTPDPAYGSNQVAAIDIAGFAYSGSTSFAAGEAITVTNSDGVAHTVTSTAGVFDTGDIAGNDTAELTAPTEPGTYDFFCTIHPSMTGSLSVSN